MKIISIAHKGSDNEFVHVIANDDVAARQIAQLKKADVNGLFTIKSFAADTFADALDYVKGEQA